MMRVLLDKVLREKLLDLRQPLQLCDATGRVVGLVTPISAPSGNYPSEPHLSEEELQRREQEPDYSTAEVLAHLDRI